ncbi:IS5 family transposase [Pleurocapsa sp. PCC 7319]|uniref:IS5 family transposase n=1 Tax=Pleurocapsa sp. PCC 7319 TaxID=118161 RepID=UPI0035297349
MYRKTSQSELTPENFELPFESKLSSENRWVIMAELIPWSDFESEYAENFSETMGAIAKPFRMALGALIIKEKLGISDRETVEQIRENPYLQYFLGMSDYSNQAPFDASMMVYFRERIDLDLVNKINIKMVNNLREKEEEETEKKEKEEVKSIKNQGKLILDATCAPGDISYPNDLGILNQARRQTEKILDSLYKTCQTKKVKKPRTYRKKARKDYLKVAKKRRPSRQERSSAVAKQLQYIKRNLSHIENLVNSEADLSSLSPSQYKMLLVVTEVYRQQLWMYENQSNRIDDRIVSITQPHIRPIVRGKAGKTVEFGAKISVSCFDQYVFLDHLSWDNFNESGDLKTQVEAYKNFTGYYPSSVHVDKIYRNRENRTWCKDRGIRISGPPLGRPPKNVSKSTKKQARDDERFRNAIEGKFGQAKRRYGLNCIMAKLSKTAETSIAVTFLVINLSTLLRQVSCLFLSLFLNTYKFGSITDFFIIKTDIKVKLLT